MKHEVQLFTPQQRELMFERITTYAGTSSDICGTLLVGSGADGFSNEYSDLDTVVVAKAVKYQAVLGSVSRFVDNELKPIFCTTYQHQDDVHVSSLLFDSYLEVDIGIWSIETLFASSEHWKIVQARDEESKARMEQAMRDNPHRKREYDPSISGNDAWWQLIFGRYMAERRGRDEKRERYEKAVQERLEEEHITIEDLPSVLTTLYSEKQVKLLFPLVYSLYGQ